MNKEQYSEAYIKGKLRDHQEYLGCEEHRRKQLITCDLYDMEQAFEDGWEESSKTIIDKACKWLISEFSQEQDRDGHPNVESRSCVSVEELIQDFRKAMDEQL